jgi:flagellar hook-associated protein 2
MAELATNLAAAQFAARTDRLAAKSELLDAQISTASNLKSMLFSLATSLGDRVRMGDLSPQPQVGNGAVAQASLSGSSQPRGT